MYLLRCLEVGLSIADLDLLEMGEVYDILIEHRNDQEKYNRIASQDDMDKF